MASFADYLPLGPFLGISDGVLIVEKVDRIIAMEDKQGNKYHLPKWHTAVHSFLNAISTNDLIDSPIHIINI